MRGITYLLGLILICTNAFANIEPGINNKKPGDVIAVRTDAQIAAWCNFDKQIVVTQMNVLCVYNGNKTQGWTLN